MNMGLLYMEGPSGTRQDPWHSSTPREGQEALPHRAHDVVAVVAVSGQTEGGGGGGRGGGGCVVAQGGVMVVG